MSQERDAPTEKVLEEVARRGLEQDKNDPNKLRDGRNNNGGQTDGQWLKTGHVWEKIG